MLNIIQNQMQMCKLNIQLTLHFLYLYKLDKQHLQEQNQKDMKYILHQHKFYNLKGKQYNYYQKVDINFNNFDMLMNQYKLHILLDMLDKKNYLHLFHYNNHLYKLNINYYHSKYHNQYHKLHKFHLLNNIQKHKFCTFHYFKLMSIQVCLYIVHLLKNYKNLKNIMSKQIMY